jgi:hypothetical protein
MLGCTRWVVSRTRSGSALSARIVPTGERFPFHDRGKVLVHAMLTLAGGGDACSDVEFLRAQPALFGPVPSDSTLYRTYRQIDTVTLAGLWGAMAEVRADVWSAVDIGERVVLDIDASLVQIHSEHKDGTAPTYKRGFGSVNAGCGRPSRYGIEFGTTVRASWLDGPRPCGESAPNVRRVLHLQD